MKLLIEEITLKPDQNELLLDSILKKKYNLVCNFKFFIIKKSLDARKKDAIQYKYRIVLIVPRETGTILQDKYNLKIHRATFYPQLQHNLSRKRVIIIGSGPAGLFAALRLVNSGITIDIFERGKPVKERMKDIRLLEKKGILDPESNILFGEGGAGTYSDGKLTTRINKPEINWILETFIKFGAKKELMYDTKPHIGTDRLMIILEKIRNYLTEKGVSFHFQEKVINFITRDERIDGIITSCNNEYCADAVICATGHSSRNMYSLLSDNKVALEAKNFAIGTRIEHPADIINRIQYGNKAIQRYDLPAADYRFAHNNPATGRSTYSFCMCPGGMIVNSSSEQGLLCVNGMSYSSRDLPCSNAAIIVSVAAEDFNNDPLEGIKLQQIIEKNAFNCGSGSFIAPAQRVTSFLQKRIDADLPWSSYRPGITPARIQDFLPDRITAELTNSLYIFNQKLKGFITSEAILVGAETRSSSPVRIVRDKTMQSVTHKGLYPAGEGSGYSGGIISSAIDGIRCANAVAEQLSQG